MRWLGLDSHVDRVEFIAHFEKFKYAKMQKKNVKENLGFHPVSVALPRDATLLDIASNYQNHMVDEVLDAFLQHKLTPRDIWVAMPESKKALFKSKTKSEDQTTGENMMNKDADRNFANPLAKRLQTRKLELEKANGIRNLHDMPKMRRLGGIVVSGKAKHDEFIVNQARKAEKEARKAEKEKAEARRHRPTASQHGQTQPGPRRQGDITNAMQQGYGIPLQDDHLTEDSHGAVQASAVQQRQGYRALQQCFSQGGYSHAASSASPGPNLSMGAIPDGTPQRFDSSLYSAETTSFGAGPIYPQLVTNQTTSAQARNAVTVHHDKVSSIPGQQTAAMANQIETLETPSQYLAHASNVRHKRRRELGEESDVSRPAKKQRVHTDSAATFPAPYVFTTRAMHPVGRALQEWSHVSLPNPYNQGETRPDRGAPASRRTILSPKSQRPVSRRLDTVPVTHVRRPASHKADEEQSLKQAVQWSPRLRQENTTQDPMNQGSRVPVLDAEQQGFMHELGLKTMLPPVEEDWLELYTNGSAEL